MFEDYLSMNVRLITHMQVYVGEYCRESSEEGQVMQKGNKGECSDCQEVADEMQVSKQTVKYVKEKVEWPVASGTCP